MTIPTVSLTIKDGGLGIAPSIAIGQQSFIGICSSSTDSRDGTALTNVVKTFNDPSLMKDIMGTGPLVEAAALTLQAGGGPVVVMKVAQSASGTAGAVTRVVSNGTSVMTITGTPLDAYSLSVLITGAAAAVTSGLGMFRYSLDGGISYSAEISLPTAATYAIAGTGLTLAFATGTLVVGDLYTSACTGPVFTITELAPALTALLANSAIWYCVNVICQPADSTAALLLAGTLTSALSTAQASYRYVMGRIQQGAGNDATLISAVVAVADSRLEIVAGTANVTSAVNGYTKVMPQHYVVAARSGIISPAEDMGYVVAGALKGVYSISRDEWATPGLDAARYTTLRTHVGLPGFYVTNSRMMAAGGSDFQYAQHRRVMDIASSAGRIALLHYLNGVTRVDKTTGFIYEPDALAIESYVRAIVDQAVLQPGYVTDVAVLVDRTINMLSTNKLGAKIRIIPLGYMKTIEAEIGFTNPALTGV
jgi:hypothetical protein